MLAILNNLLRNVLVAQICAGKDVVVSLAANLFV
jgi:hypothetical protein